MKTNFNFHIPIDIEKSIKKDKDGNNIEVMRLTGVASTMDEDTDKEILDPNGFDCSYFMKAGFLNWNHNHSPENYIGEPVSVEIKDNKFYVTAELYNWSPLAKSVYTLAQNLQKSKSSRRLGFSIEGKALERDELNPNYVKKAAITGLALTMTPKNNRTFVDIIKGMLDPEEKEIALDYDIDTIEKTLNEINEYILDIDTPEGRLCVDKNMNVKIIKKEKIQNLDKALTTQSGSPIIRESLEGAPKILTKSEKESILILSKAIENNLIPTENISKIKDKINTLFNKKS